jgi:hypothetical protein
MPARNVEFPHPEQDDLQKMYQSPFRVYIPLSSVLHQIYAGDKPLFSFFTTGSPGHHAGMNR